MELVSFIDGLLVGMLIVILIVKIRSDRRKSITRMGEVALTKEQAEKVLEMMLKDLRDDDLPIEKENDNE